MIFKGHQRGTYRESSGKSLNCFNLPHQAINLGQHYLLGLSHISVNEVGDGGK